MAIMLADWLVQMRARFEKPTDDFALFLFKGTQAELEPALTAWTRPDDVELVWFDVATQLITHDTMDDAAAGIESNLSQLSRKTGKLLLVITGINILASLFPDQLLVPVFKHLRRSNRAVLAVVPPEPPKRLPSRVRLDDWRGALARETGADQTVVPTGGHA